MPVTFRRKGKVMDKDSKIVNEQEEKPTEELTAQELDEAAGGALDAYLQLKGQSGSH